MRGFGASVSEITQNVFLCGKADITESNLRKFDITHILNTAIELKDFVYPTVDGTSINAKHITMFDDEEENLLLYLNDCIDYIHSVVESGGNILVHCIGGISRSASVCIAYLVKYENVTLKKAYFHVLHRRPWISPNLGFWEHLVTFEEVERGSNSVQMLPFIFGSVPDLYIADAEYRLKSAWMGNLMFNWTIHFIILAVQVLIISFKN